MRHSVFKLLLSFSRGRENTRMDEMQCVPKRRPPCDLPFRPMTFVAAGSTTKLWSTTARPWCSSPNTPPPTPPSATCTASWATLKAPSTTFTRCGPSQLGLRGCQCPVRTRQQKSDDSDSNWSVFPSQALGLKRDDTFSVTMLGHCIEMYIGDTDAYIGRTRLSSVLFVIFLCLEKYLMF